MDPSRLPPAPTSEAIRTAIFNELLAGHVPRQRAIEITRRMEQDIENWVVDINVQRNDLVHQLAVSIAEALSQLQRP
jgi:tryptophan synthase beta subunit